MSYTLARAQIVSIVEDVTVTAGTLLGQTFEHTPEASDDEVPTSRCFWIVGGDAGIDDPLGAIARAHIVRDVTINVAYPDHDDEQALDEVIAEDWYAIALALANPENWDRPTSTIVSLDSAGALLAMTVRQVPGASILSISFPLEYTP